MVKNLPANAGDVRNVGLIPGLGRSPTGGHGNPLQYSCLEIPMDRGAWQATVHKVAKSQTQLKQLSMLHNGIKYFLKRWTGCLCEGRNFIVYIPHTSTEYLLYAKHSARCLKGKTAYNMVL